MHLSRLEYPNLSATLAENTMSSASPWSVPRIPRGCCSNQIQHGGVCCTNTAAVGLSSRGFESAVLAFDANLWGVFVRWRERLPTKRSRFGSAGANVFKSSNRPLQKRSFLIILFQMKNPRPLLCSSTVRIFKWRATYAISLYVLAAPTITVCNHDGTTTSGISIPLSFRLFAGQGGHGDGRR